MITMKRYFILLLYLFCQLSLAETTAQTQNKLALLSNRIKTIQHHLTEAISTQHALHRGLAQTEKKLGEQIKNYHALQNDLHEKHNAIQQIEKKLNALNITLEKEQNRLAHHLQIRYKMTENEPIKLIFNQKDPSIHHRHLIYYQAILTSDKHLIQQVKQTLNQQTTLQSALTIELAELQALEKKSMAQQKILQQLKNHDQALIQKINRRIKSKEQNLSECKEDQERLQSLLKKLTQSVPTRIMTKVSTLHLTPNLVNPLQEKSSRTQRLNQGIIFFAPEGLPVHAVLPGKIVFSDWLKGYGLLIIIDHGNGMMSLYAHNESLFKSKGNLVKKGEQIARVGHTGGLRENGLYFEIRRRGKAIPPRQWLA